MPRAGAKNMPSHQSRRYAVHTTSCDAVLTIICHVRAAPDILRLLKHMYSAGHSADDDISPKRFSASARSHFPVPRPVADRSGAQPVTHIKQKPAGLVSRWLNSRAASSIHAPV